MALLFGTMALLTRYFKVYSKVGKGNAAFKLVSPSLEAADMVKKLEGRDDKVIKMVLFSLKENLKVRGFWE